MLLHKIQNLLPGGFAHDRSIYGQTVVVVVLVEPSERMPDVDMISYTFSVAVLKTPA